jgi:hypothetical protein
VRTDSERKKEFRKKEFITLPQQLHQVPLVLYSYKYGSEQPEALNNLCNN